LDEPIMTDAQFNKLEDQIKAIEPSWKELHKTGVRTVEAKSEVELARFMPSLEKAYPEDVPRFTKRAAGKRHFGMVKLDGCSLQLDCFGGEPKTLVTRGDGKLGRDVSYLIPALIKYKCIPGDLPFAGRLILRIEGVMASATFKAKYSKEALGEKGYDNPRNFVNGLFNRMEASKALADVSMVVLGIYPNAIEAELAATLKRADSFGFETVTTFSTDATAEDLTAKLALHKKRCAYEIDGLVVAPLDFVMDYKNTDKPKGIFAFKVNDEENALQVRVKSIHWKKTRLNRWHPKVMIEPVRIDGVTVTRATAHNPAWMKERGIGPGAIVKILRSGGVIPKIVGVVERAPFKEPPGPYVQRGRFFYATDGDSSVRDVRAIHFFFTTLDIELLAEKTITKLYDAGYKDVRDYIAFAPGIGNRCAKWLRACQMFAKTGLGDKQVENIMNELKRVLCSEIPLKSLMIASGAFENGGMGVRKLEQLEEQGMSMKHLCNASPQEIWDEVGKFKGWKSKTITVLADGVAAFRTWYKPIKGMLQVNAELPVKKVAKGNSLARVNVAWTSYRSEEQEQLVEELGGTIVKYGAKMDVLLYKEGAKFMDKINAAGSKAMTWEQFKEKYGV
jgi:DNA ligase (NAD+)